MAKPTAATCFNPRARDGRDFKHIDNFEPETGFNPRARDGRDMATHHLQKSLPCFNPRARDGRDVDELVFDLNDGSVSIHAPVMGATTGTDNSEAVNVVSIHAPVMGATAVPS